MKSIYTQFVRAQTRFSILVLFQMYVIITCCHSPQSLPRQLRRCSRDEMNHWQNCRSYPQNLRDNHDLVSCIRLDHDHHDRDLALDPWEQTLCLQHPLRWVIRPLEYLNSPGLMELNSLGHLCQVTIHPLSQAQLIYMIPFVRIQAAMCKSQNARKVTKQLQHGINRSNRHPQKSAILGPDVSETLER